jgi:putative Ca2+/H+ antiporter (TMEM165/GDT1 family)
MNLIAILAGYTVILFVPREVIDWIGFFCFLFFGLYWVYEGMKMESKSVKEEYEEEMQETEANYNLVNDQENNNQKSTWKLCFELFAFLCISEFGDKSEISTVTIAAVYNLYAVLMGTMIAYFFAIAIAAFLGHYVGQYLTEKMMSIIGGLLFVGFAIQILVIKLFFV